MPSLLLPEAGQTQRQGWIEGGKGYKDFNFESLRLKEEEEKKKKKKKKTNR